MLGDSLLPPPTYVEVDRARIATYVLEPQDRDPVGDVVLCHGTPWSSAVWGPVARHLSSERRVFMWDMPGYGRSISGRSTPLDLVTQRGRFAAMLEHWELTGAHVVAHDIGGAVALGAHLLEMAPMASLYLLDVVTLDPWGSPFFRLVAQHQDVFAALPPNLHAALVREYVSGAAHRQLDVRWVDELTGPWCTPDGQRSFYQQIAELSPDHTKPVVEGLRGTRCPVRVGWGEQDPWLPVTQATELANRLPGRVEVATFLGAGHLVPVEATQALAEDISRWLREAR